VTEWFKSIPVHKPQIAVQLEAVSLITEHEMAAFALLAEAASTRCCGDGSFGRCLHGWFPGFVLTALTVTKEIMMPFGRKRQEAAAACCCCTAER
jgi:hypothetical protein